MKNEKKEFEKKRSILEEYVRAKQDIVARHEQDDIDMASNVVTFLKGEWRSL